MVTVPGCFKSSIMRFHVVIKALMTMTRSGQPCNTPLVAAHQAPKQPIILKTLPVELAQVLDFPLVGRAHTTPSVWI